MKNRAAKFSLSIIAALVVFVSSCGIRDNEQPAAKSGFIMFDGQKTAVTFRDFDEQNVIIWGDILVERSRILSPTDERLALAAFGSKDGGFVLIWPSARVPYVLPPGFPTAWKADWDFMVAEWKKAGISWVPRLATDVSYVDVRLVKGLPSGVCGISTLGMVRGGATVFSLRDPSEVGICNVRTTILHEASHALGFTHEHQRPDRDRFIKLNPALTAADSASFNILPNALAYTPFDVSSVTLYNSFFFKLDGTTIPFPVVLSSSDIAGAQWRYQSGIQIDKPSINASLRPGDYIGRLSVTGPAGQQTNVYALAFSPSLLQVEIRGDQVFYKGPSILEPGVHEFWVEARSVTSGFGVLQPIRIEVLPRDLASAIMIDKTLADSCRTCLPYIRTYGAGNGVEWKAPVLMWFYPRLATSDKFEWSFADGVSAKSNVVIREFNSPGDFDFVVTVTDAAGQKKAERYEFRIN